jgi:hypothetical protein
VERVAELEAFDGGHGAIRLAALRARVALGRRDLRASHPVALGEPPQTSPHAQEASA